MARFVFYDLPQDVKDKIVDLRAAMAANRMLLAGYRFLALLEKANFNPNQARVPLGNPDGGRWTGGGGGSHGERIAVGGSLTQVALETDPRNDAVDLLEEEGRGGHAIRDHVGKSPNALLAIVRGDRGSFGIFSYARKREGSFPSVAAATRLVNSTLAQNSARVARVASGVEPDAFVTAQFASKTGIEAYSPSAMQAHTCEIHMEWVYSSGTIEVSNEVIAL